MIVQFLVAIGAAACGTDDKGASQNDPVNAGEQKEIERDVQEMQDKGIIDQDGRPAPGVDLEDYPGLG